MTLPRQLRDRLGSRRSTAAGLVLGLAALASVFMELASWAQVTPVLLAALALLATKEKPRNHGKTTPKNDQKNQA
jgi:hypothetical protein